MCGIVGYIGSQEASPILIEGLRTLEYRGYDSSGIAVFDHKLNMVKSKGRLINLEDKLKVEDLQGVLGIGHTRWATHGEPSDHNAHPHMNESGTIALVHNGIIENYISLKEELIEKGYRFISETDTEIAVQLIDLYYKEDNNLLEAVIAALHRIEGSFALAVVAEEEPDKIIATRKDSPLVLGIGDGENFIASDVPAILRHTRKVYFIEDYEIAVVTKDDIVIMDMDQKRIKREIFNVTWDIQAAEKAGYEHFMLKEIYEQPKVIRDTLTPRLPMDQDDVYLDGINLEKEVLEKITRIYVIACGTAYYSGLIGKELIEKYARIPVIAEVASEFRYKDPILDENTLMIVVSQSGETADTLAALRMAKKAGAHVLGVVNAVGSSISREADDVLYTWAGPEIAVASTKAYSAQLCAMYLISMKISLVLGKLSTEEFRELRAALYQLPSQVEHILENANLIEAMAKKHVNMKNVFYIGRGLDYAVAMEGALKIKEIAYLHAEPYPAGELKHGPIALIEEGSLLMGLLGQESLFDKTVSNIKEVKARGASIMAIAMEGNKEVEQVAEDVIYIPRTHWSLVPLLENIPQQLFAYYIAKNLGHDIDKPRNLAKSVTVE
ncbi:L-glutamine-D-fructose-6-phosphate amidotransferase [Petrocella atlantisensis]|uniref:Glutamine--fructose-6-phosphate aminotransferase [isomerizing] n=1 Tax=Petrocella atlantisensis TaxID=2173034 RepID=A0A3P7P1L7_9FIRM|nr:glutamine--fructose-6-phosphate transaminase (isomerizing) [Petrocella atlantisensis]MCF8019227.1 glutamine--fructose-6-phosphate transaminase (isomerizing) [Vallitaleaceae bacterium]VDN47390.1 L-glutamine-D-fructose-6-phosphate amidotransferase [Petrocella atlantisensis]